MKLDGHIRALAPPLERIYIYHYLHRKHQELATRVEAVIRDMDAGGDLVRMRQTLTKQLLDDAASKPR